MSFTEASLATLLRSRFGHGMHASGGFYDDGGCLFVMRSAREEDTTKPWLDALRKAAGQFSGTKPSTIAVQLQDIGTSDLAAERLRLQAMLTANALFGHYGAYHVNAIHVSNFEASVVPGSRLREPSFVIVNSDQKFPAWPGDLPVLRGTLPE